MCQSAQSVLKYCDWSDNKLIVEFKATTASVLLLIDLLNDYALYETVCYGKYTRGKMT